MKKVHMHYLLRYQMIPTLVFADLPVGSFTIDSLKKTDRSECDIYNKCCLQCNLIRTQVMVFNREGKLKNREYWCMYGQRLQVLSKSLYIYK